MPKLRDMSGMSLLEVLMGVGLLALLVPLGYKLMLTSTRVSKKTEDRLELRSVSRTLMQKADCEKLPASCSAGSLIALPQKGGGSLLNSAGPTIIGGWAVRALCVSGNQFRVQVARLLPGGSFAKDPVDGRILDFNHPQATLFAERALCSSKEAPTPETVNLMTVIPGASCFVGQLSQLPCAAPDPPPCALGYVSAGVSLDGWGGDDDANHSDVFGVRWVRYCVKTET